MIKKILAGGLAAVLLVGTMAIVAEAEPWRYTFDPDSAAILQQTSNTLLIVSPGFKVPSGVPITFAAIVTDSGAGNTTSTDSIALTLQTGIDVGENSVLSTNAQWTDGCEIVLGWAKGIDERSEVRYLSVDSINLGTYKVGPFCRVVMHSGTAIGGGGENPDDTIECDVTIDAYVSWPGQE